LREREAKYEATREVMSFYRQKVIHRMFPKGKKEEKKQRQPDAQKIGNVLRSFFLFALLTSSSLPFCLLLLLLSSDLFLRKALSFSLSFFLGLWGNVRMK